MTDLAVFRLRPASSGHWSSALLTAADAIDRLVLGAVLEAHAREVEPGCTSPGATTAAAALLAVGPAHMAAVLLEGVLVALLAQERGLGARSLN